MVTKKDLVIAILCTFCLTVSLFMIIPTRSSPSTGNYDPWIDVNDDGVIDISDLVIMVGRIPSSSEHPINKTALLLELQFRVDVLNASLLNLEAYFETRIDTLNATIVEQQFRIAELETEVAVLNATKLNREPDYDSGWFTVPPSWDKTLTHNLNTTEVFVYMIGAWIDGAGSWHIHQMSYGGDQYWYPSGGYNKYAGVMWTDLSKTTIRVIRWGDDWYWEYIRVMIWKIPEP